jgi:mannose-6-phosphate isomerase-like protein (cupin superfamily)
LPVVEETNLKDHVHFSPDGVRRETVFDTSRLWAEVLCFERNQQVGPVMDPDSDALFTVAAGQAVVQVDNRRKRVSQWDSVLVPAGSEVTVTNASGDPLVLFLVAAPPPVPRAVSG